MMTYLEQFLGLPNSLMAMGHHMAFFVSYYTGSGDKKAKAMQRELNPSVQIGLENYARQICEQFRLKIQDNRPISSELMINSFESLFNYYDQLVYGVGGRVDGVDDVYVKCSPPEQSLTKKQIELKDSIVGVQKATCPNGKIKAMLTFLQLFTSTPKEDIVAVLSRENT